MAEDGLLGSILGLGGSLFGGLLGGSSASKRRKELREIANTPGVDIGSVYGDAFGAMASGLPQAQDLAGAQNTFNASELDRLLESSLPGLKGMQSQRAGNIASFLRGEIPDDVSDQVFRRGAAQSVAGGFAGSPAGRNLVARDLGRTSLDLMNLGSGQLNSAIGSAPLPRILQTQDLLNIGPRETLGVRSGERAQRIQGLQAAAGSPGSSDVWGRIMQDMGGTLFGQSGGFGSIIKGLGKIF